MSFDCALTLLVSDVGVAQAGMECLLQRFGLPGYGQLAWHWAATLLLGFLLYHWQLGLQLLPVAAASLALSAVAGMRPFSSRGSQTENGRSRGVDAADGSICWHDNSRAGSSGGGGSSGQGPGADSFSSGSSSRLLPVWPSQTAGGLLAADCCLLGLLLCVSQQTGLGSGLLAALLAATPRLLAVVVLLLGGQVVVDVLCRGWWGHRELRHASLLCRCWLMAAAGVLAASGSSSASLASILAAAAAWAQKAHMLLVEGPVLVLYLGSLLPPLQEQQQAVPVQQQGRGQRGGVLFTASAGASSRANAGSSSSGSPSQPGAATVTAVADAAPSSTFGASALLCCLHFLLQLLVLLFVPPGPLAAALWLPQPLQSLLVWGARVLLCGSAVQLALSAFSSSDSASAAPVPGVCASPIVAAGALGWGSPTAQPKASSSAQHGVGSSSGCAAGLTRCQQQFGGMAASCCSSPSPRGRKGWELQLHGHSANSSSSGRCGGSHALCDADLGSSWAVADCAGAGFSLSRSGVLGVPSILGISTGTGDASGSCATALGVCRLLWQHAPYVLLLAAGFAGDTFITAAAPTAASSILAGTQGAAAAAAAAAAGWAVRAAWQRVLQYCMVAGLCLEVVLAARRELALLLRLPLFPGAMHGSSRSRGVFLVPGWQRQTAAAG